MATSTFEQINQDMKAAMKAQDKQRLAAIRLIFASLKNAKIDNKGELSEEDIVNVLSSEAKKRRDSAQMYRDNDSEEHALKEEYELSIIQEYLPKQLTDDEVKALIDEVIAQTGASSKSDIGKVMGPMMAKVKGRYDGSKVKNLVMEKLS